MVNIAVGACGTREGTGGPGRCSAEPKEPLAPAKFSRRLLAIGLGWILTVWHAPSINRGRELVFLHTPTLYLSFHSLQIFFSHLGALQIALPSLSSEEGVLQLT